eukprot:Rhum_TRINITY_DN17899_c0_g1::Rhum_TRINITY_DN17899_c0_g1_i1::g.166661::m.166661
MRDEARPFSWRCNRRAPVPYEAHSESEDDSPFPQGWGSGGCDGRHLSFCTDHGWGKAVSPAGEVIGSSAASGSSSEVEPGLSMLPMTIGGEPAIPLSTESATLRVNRNAPVSSRKAKKRCVAWATPNSLHDTRIITPYTHPNRMGQFNVRTAKPSAFQGLLTRPKFDGSVGEQAEVALMDKNGLVGWVDCGITVKNSDNTYDIVVHPSSLADTHHVSNLAAYAICAAHLRSKSSVHLDAPASSK